MSLVDASANARAAACRDVSGPVDNGDEACAEISRIAMSCAVVRPASLPTCS